MYHASVLKTFFKSVENKLNIDDEISKVKVFRINRDVRFSKNKTPYNVHRSVSFSRSGAHRRGGYYLRIEPGKSAMAGGFFSPEATDLLRIRKEFELDATEIKEIINHKDFKKAFGGFNQDYRLKTAPRNFSREDVNIDLIKLKSYFVVHKFTDEEVLSEDFEEMPAEEPEMEASDDEFSGDDATDDMMGDIEDAMDGEEDSGEEEIEDRFYLKDVTKLDHEN